MKTAVIYARYSSERQNEQSIEGQLRACNEYAARNNVLIVDTYIDRAMTGTNDNRASFQKMLFDSKKRAWDIVLVYKLDRFSRNKYEMATNRRTLRDNGVRIVSAMENIPDTPEGIIIESLLEGMAEYYSAELSQKIRRGMNECRLKGHYTGGGLPYGYKISDRKFVVDEEKAEVVRFIFQQYATGTIVKNIITALNEKGIMNRGKSFGRNAVYGILKNERYSGVYHYGEKEYTDTFPQIVPNHVYEVVAKMMEENQYGKHSIEVVYLLREKIICGHCNRPVSAESGTSKNGKVKRYYKCLGRKHNNGCKKTNIRKEVLENLIVEITCKVLNNPATINLVAETIIAAHQKRLTDQSVLKILLNEQSEIRKSIANIVAAIEKGVVTNSTKRRLDELETAQEELSAKIAIERTKLTIRLTKDEIVKYIKTALKKDPKQMIDLLIKRIVLFDDKIEIIYNYTDRGSADDGKTLGNTNPDAESRDFIFHRCSIKDLCVRPTQVIYESGFGLRLPLSALSCRKLHSVAVFGNCCPTADSSPTCSHSAIVFFLSTLRRGQHRKRVEPKFNSFNHF